MTTPIEQLMMLVRGGTQKRRLDDIVAQGRVDIREFGAIGNDTADDTVPIQKAVDYALQNGIAKVYGPPGFVCKTTDSIHLGYGVSGFSSITLESDETTIGGLCAFKIKGYFVDRPIINIQGARQSGIRNIMIEGGTNQIASLQGGTLLSRATASNYVPSGAATTARAPFCGVCIDGYSTTDGTTGAGQLPAVPYPTPTYPAYLGVVTGAYGRTYSSGWYVENCVIQYCNVGIMVGPNSNSNDDFGKVTNTEINFCRDAVAIGTSQPRVTNYTFVKVNNCHTVFNGTDYNAGTVGSGLGNFAGSFDCLHVNYIYQWFNINASRTGPLVMTNAYSEECIRFGDFVSGGDMRFIGCVFNFADANIDAPNAGTEIYNKPTATYLSATFQNCDILYARAAFYFQNCDVYFESCSFRFLSSGSIGGWSPLGATELAAVVAMGGVLLDFEPSAVPGRPRFVDCGTTHAGSSLTGYDTGSMWSWHSHGAKGYSIHEYDFPNYTRMQNIGAPSGTSYSGKVLSGNFGAGQFYKVSDLIYAYTGTFAQWYFITAYNSGTGAVTMEAMSNYKWDGATYTMLDATIPGNWLYFPVNIGDSAFDTDKFMVTTVGSAVVNVVDGAGVAATRPAGITTSSKPLWFQPDPKRYANTTPFPSATVVSSVAANSFTMNQNALTAGTWIMAPGIRKLK